MSTRKSIDWDEVKRRIGAGQAAIDPSQLAANGTRLEQVYRERAWEFAARSAAADDAADSWPALSFTVGTERLCIALSVLAEVLPYARCAAIPGAPPELLGVINVRGRICSVLDLARILELPAAGERVGGYIVLVRHAGVEVGLRADQVDQIRQVALETPSPQAGGMVLGEYFRGRTSDRQSVLDPQKILSHPIFKTDCFQ